MRAGALRHIITIQSVTRGLNEYRTPTETWNDHLTIRAALIDNALNELAPVGGTADEEAIKLHCRFAPVTTEMRLIFRGETFNIKRIKSLRNGREMELEAVKLGASDEGP